MRVLTARWHRDLSKARNLASSPPGRFVRIESRRVESVSRMIRMGVSRRRRRSGLVAVITTAMMIGSGLVGPATHAAENNLLCDGDCIASGSWSHGPFGIDVAAAIGVGNVSAILENGIEVDFGGTTARLLREGTDDAIWETPFEGLGGLMSHTSLFDLANETATGQPIAIGQPVRVEGGSPPAVSGGAWIGFSHVRLHWWEGRQYFVAGTSLDQQFAAAVGIVVAADGDGVQLRIADAVSSRNLWVAAYPGTPIGRIVATAGSAPYDGLAVEF